MEVTYADVKFAGPKREPISDSHPTGTNQRKVIAGMCGLAVLCMALLALLIWMALRDSLQKSVCEPESLSTAQGTKSPDNDTDVTNVTQKGALDDTLRGSCPSDWIRLNQKCYYFSEEKNNKYEGERSCVSLDSRLARLTQKDSLLRQIITLTSQEYWAEVILLNKVWDQQSQQHEMKATWADGTSELVLEASGSCIKVGRYLHTDNCYQRLRWVCERDPSVRIIDQSD
uniref:C-type lectin domain-containing protein n=1 Tax=Xenopus tropicalis TaxID=8364 RepID=A0A803JT63_XENTR